MLTALGEHASGGLAEPMPTQSRGHATRPPDRHERHPRSALTTDIIPCAPRIGPIVHIDDMRDEWFLIIGIASNVQVVHGQTSAKRNGLCHSSADRPELRHLGN